MASGRPARTVLDVLVQSRRDKHAAKRLMRKLLKKHGRAPRVLITDKLKSYAAANKDLGLDVEHRQRDTDMPALFRGYERVRVGSTITYVF